MSISIAIVSPGAMGSAIAARMLRHGARVITALEGRSAASIERARASGMQPVTWPDLLDADLFLSVVPPAQALPLAQQFSTHARAANRPVAPYVDLNAVNPAHVALVATEVDSCSHFIDGCIIGPPPSDTASMPTSLHLSGGPSGEIARTLQALGLNAFDMAAPCGAASALKMSYAGINKGLVALSACMLLAANRNGAGNALIGELERSQPALLAGLRYSVPDMLPKAWRWVPEMEQIRDFIGTTLPESTIYEAMGAFYERMASLPADASEREILSAGGGAFDNAPTTPRPA